MRRLIITFVLKVVIYKLFIIPYLLRASEKSSIMNMKSKINKVDPKSWIEFLDQYMNPGPQY